VAAGLQLALGDALQGSMGPVERCLALSALIWVQVLLLPCLLVVNTFAWAGQEASYLICVSLLPCLIPRQAIGVSWSSRPMSLSCEGGLQKSWRIISHFCCRGQTRHLLQWRGM
jgi:hypothetical protein